ncbi:MAG: uL22 family ribosomal protein [Verrucomicrobiales bacterium]
MDTLIIKEATVGEGPTLKRFMPRARGSAAPIRKRTSHIRIVLTDDTAVLNKRTTRQDNARLGVKTGN